MNTVYYAISNDQYLAHHGVLGMKWGVRKRRPSKSGTIRNVKRATIGNYMPEAKERLAARDKQIKNEYFKQYDKYKKNKKLTKGYVNASYNQSIATLEKNTLSNRTRAKLHDNISLGKSKVGSYVKAYASQYVKDVAKGTAAVTGAAFIAYNLSKGNLSTMSKVGRAASIVAPAAIYAKRSVSAIKQNLRDKKKH